MTMENKLAAGSICLSLMIVALLAVQYWHG